MIKEIEQKDLAECVTVIRDSFATVAAEFGITEENAPRFTAFATNEGRLYWHLNGEHRPMYGYARDGRIVEENTVLRKWYKKFGFVHVGTQKFEFFPFTCGYMEKVL